MGFAVRYDGNTLDKGMSTGEIIPVHDKAGASMDGGSSLHVAQASRDPRHRARKQYHETDDLNDSGQGENPGLDVLDDESDACNKDGAASHSLDIRI
jgi:hypothetical protein